MTGHGEPGGKRGMLKGRCSSDQIDGVSRSAFALEVELPAQPTTGLTKIAASTTLGNLSAQSVRGARGFGGLLMILVPGSRHPNKSGLSSLIVCSAVAYGRCDYRHGEALG